jgi:hypothetical protein
VALPSVTPEAACVTVMVEAYDEPLSTVGLHPFVNRSADDLTDALPDGGAGVFHLSKCN